MKHFTITSSTEAAALRPFASEPIKVGHIVTPSAGNVTHTAWANYPEADALTFEQCMSVVRDEVDCGTIEIDDIVDIDVTPPHYATLRIQEGHNEVSFGISNVTTTKIKLLAAILRGEDI